MVPIQFSIYREACNFAKQRATRTGESVPVHSEGKLWIVEIEPRAPIQRSVPASKNSPRPKGEVAPDSMLGGSERPCIGNSAACQTFVPAERVKINPRTYRCVHCQTKYLLENPPPPPAEFAGNRDWHKRQRGWR